MAGYYEHQTVNWNQNDSNNVLYSLHNIGSQKKFETGPAFLSFAAEERPAARTVQ